MDERVKAELSRHDQTPFHRALLQKVKGLVEMSRSDMSEYYDSWDDAVKVYSGERKSCSKDGAKDGEPKPIVVPLTYAQIQTFIAFAIGLLTQRDKFYELTGTGEEDHRAAKLAEALLERDLLENQWTVMLYQFFLDLGRHALGVVKHSWVDEKETVWERVEVTSQKLGPFAILGRMFNPSAGVEPEKQYEDRKVERTKYKGNKLSVVSPYRFYPDTRLPLTRFQEGEFCASEEEVTRTALHQGEQSGLYAGVRHVKDLTTELWNKRKNTRFRHATNINPRTTSSDKIDNTVILTEVQVRIVPSEFELAGGERLGDSTFPETWIVVYANDERIVRAEPMGYVHNNFTYRVAQFSPDQHQLVNETISSMIGHLQAVIDWFINSHITNVRRHISNRLVVDPAAVYFEDLRDHKPVIRLKPDVAFRGVDNFVKQLQVTDITRAHVSDVDVLVKFVYMTTAISDNLMGQFHTGRRSAREASNVSNASGARLRTVVKMAYDGCFVPLGQDMISNHRDGLDEQLFVKIVGDEFPDWSAFDHFVLPQEQGVMVGIDRTDLSKRYDFNMFDGTLPSEKAQQAETLEQILLAMMQNPDGIAVLTQILGYDPKKLFTEVLTLRGIKHPNRFKIDEVRMAEFQQMQQQQQIAENGPVPTDPGPPGLPGPAASPPVPAGQPSFESLLG